jgi:hypothetical protein
MAFSDHATLGYDPTVERVYVDGQEQYKYLVEGTWYVTTGCLSSLRSRRLIGRATRVWEVKEWSKADAKDAPRYALKDVWLDIDASTERQIQEDIFHKFNTVNPIDMPQETARSYFMGIRACEEVVHGEVKDRTSGFPKHDFISLKSSTEVKQEASMRSSRTGSSAVGLATEEPATFKTQLAPRRRFYRPKKHCRVLFDEVGIPLYKLTDLKVFYAALADTCRGELIHA